MKLPLSLKPSRFQIALLLALIPIFVLGDRVANFTRGGTIHLTTSRDQRFVAIHHDELLWFDRFRILDRENDRLVAIPKKSFLWNHGQYLKEIDGKWFLAISYSTLHKDRCWVQRIDKNTLAWEKPRWIPGDPVAWGNGKILCRFQGNFTIVDENDTRQKQELQDSWWLYSLSRLQFDNISLALHDNRLKSHPMDLLCDAYANDEQITLLGAKEVERSRPRKHRLTVEKIRISTGERTSLFELPTEDAYVLSCRLMNDGQDVLVYSPEGLHVFDTQSQKVKFTTKDLDMGGIRCDPWIVLVKEPNFYFLNTKTLEKSRVFPLPKRGTLSQLPINDTEYLTPSSNGELELRGIQSDALLQTYCDHRYEPILRIVLITCMVIWLTLWWWSNRSNELFYPIIVAASLACIVYPLWMRVKFQGIEEEFGVLANGMMSGVITGLFSASWIGLLLGRGNFALRFLYFSICIFAAGGVLLQQQESKTVLFHVSCVATLLVLLLPLLLARWMNWQLPIEGVQGSQKSRFQLSLASLLALGTSVALIMGAVRYDPYMCEVYLQHIDRSKDWRAIITLSILLAIVPLASLQFCLLSKSFYLRFGILLGSIIVSLVMTFELSWEFTDPEM